MSQDNLRKLKKGEVLFREGESAQTVYVVQSGRIGLYLDRGGRRLEISTAGPSQVLGEQCLTSAAKHAFLAEAMQETKVLEVPAEVLKQQFEKAQPGIKLLVKSLIEETKHSRLALRSAKMETEKVPCPQAAIPRLFTIAHLLARHIGKSETPGFASVSWGSLKLYANRFFGESPQRLRQLMNLLNKLQMAKLEMKPVEEEEAPDEDLANIEFTCLQTLEDFAEFYQYHLFKGPSSESIAVDPLALRVARFFVEISLEAPKNHHGASVVDFDEVLTKFKETYRQDLKSVHLDLLEKKGLFVQRKSHDNGKITIAFDRQEFEKTATYWSVIHEVDKWNDKGFVDLHEKEESMSAGAQGTCPGCGEGIEADHKFCAHCGFKLAA